MRKRMAICFAAPLLWLGGTPAHAVDIQQYGLQLLQQYADDLAASNQQLSQTAIDNNWCANPSLKKIIIRSLNAGLYIDAISAKKNKPDKRVVDALKPLTRNAFWDMTMRPPRIMMDCSTVWVYQDGTQEKNRTTSNLYTDGTFILYGSGLEEGFKRYYDNK